MTTTTREQWEHEVRRTVELAKRAEFVVVGCAIALVFIVIFSLIVPPEPQYLGFGFFSWPVITLMIGCHTFYRGVERACIVYQNVVELQKRVIEMQERTIATYASTEAASS